LEDNIEKHAIDYLKGNIDKNGLKKLIQRNYKSSKKTQFANMHRSMYVDGITSIIRYCINEIRDTRPKPPEKENILQNTITLINNLTEYTENNLKKLGDLFNSEKPKLSNTQHRIEISIKRLTSLLIKNFEKFRVNNDFKLISLSQEILCSLTRTKNDKELISFLKDNPTWSPNADDISANFRRREAFY
jgi:hypothetical protein